MTARCFHSCGDSSWPLQSRIKQGIWTNPGNPHSFCFPGMARSWYVRNLPARLYFSQHFLNKQRAFYQQGTYLIEKTSDHPRQERPFLDRKATPNPFVLKAMDTN